MEAARSIDNWGLAVELARYHEADKRALNIRGQMHALEIELQCVQATARHSHGRLEGAQAHHRLVGLQSLDENRVYQHGRSICHMQGRGRLAL